MAVSEADLGPNSLSTCRKKGCSRAPASRCALACPLPLLTWPSHGL